MCHSRFKAASDDSHVEQSGGRREQLLGQAASVAGAGRAAVDGPELLIAGPGQFDLAVRIAQSQAEVELAVLALGEVLQAVPQQSADLVERVVLVTASVQLFLLTRPTGLLRHDT